VSSAAGFENGTSAADTWILNESRPRSNPVAAPALLDASTSNFRTDVSLCLMDLFADTFQYLGPESPEAFIPLGETLDVGSDVNSCWRANTRQRFNIIEQIITDPS